MDVTSTPSKSRIYSSLILATIFWGGSFLFSKIGLRDMPPLYFVFFRFLMAAMIMLVLFGYRLKRMTRQTFTRGMIVGLVLGITNISFAFGVKDTSISRAGVLNNLFVLFIPLITRVVWKEQVGRINMAGIALAVSGIWLLASSGGQGFNQGDMISTLCALFIACHIIAVAKVIKDDDIYLVSGVQFATVALIAGAAALATSEPPAGISVPALTSLIYCAIFPTVICFTLQNTYQRYVTPTMAGLLFTLDPVWSLLAGFFALGERLSSMEWAGCAMIFMAVLLPLIVRRVIEWRQPAM
ncbi:MAG TPA: EamA family transporter [Deltaproteobacteria bacterium]|nr:EamA family transporter [Deltaproteobacteria bacterium]HQB39791.1 EamA family transporter [Deltaproteobacteria bacterium]